MTKLEQAALDLIVQLVEKNTISQAIIGALQVFDEHYQKVADLRSSAPTSPKASRTSGRFGPPKVAGPWRKVPNIPWEEHERRGLVQVIANAAVLLWLCEVFGLLDTGNVRHLRWG